MVLEPGSGATLRKRAPKPLRHKELVQLTRK